MWPSNLHSEKIADPKAIFKAPDELSDAIRVKRLGRVCLETHSAARP